MDNIPHKTFADLDFAELNSEAFDAYIEYRVKGQHAQSAFVRVFGEDTHSHIICEYIEHNPYYHRQFKKRLKEIKVEELWNDKMAISELLATARNPYFKDSTRLNAIKELNILIGITVVDENGKTKQGRSLSDFYGSERQS
jgi:hypothetical protein